MIRAKTGSVEALRLNTPSVRMDIVQMIFMLVSFSTAGARRAAEIPQFRDGEHLRKLDSLLRTERRNRRAQPELLGQNQSRLQLPCTRDQPHTTFYQPF